ncbi:FKBP-type peptidyl-prolyl cis-trans isomerase [Paucibacter sp. O1-1]|uniref:FKBP-type peptidyl-prolyl cis-trans isomerase n=1 Tax=unclassified Roseateles TaxID=2626991 RepID=UPI0010F984CE|nr:MULTISPECIES: FKBP-type peptidyl-prolyl cis-trans isomerase [unclassified Roseateles]MCU7375311.1 FKBP-type peptidyl-prolyl cis-trans isomerase [Paucibacter sp. O1-1]MCZ7884480.1 FKBP-type peptidyl-prolyl cis-trans isomerase [Paucibacter sp. M5-1]MDA3830318.1 FKBP-type peptidyl-prolyl cis-trans isomerase [Paucibacter sp. O1-1]MDC6165948.1 FKBP-type peptidyl-prolyl cis-trans isomerase [Paucibacter sp. XJ19-41]
MKIQKDTIATLKLKVADAKGKLIEESKEPMACLIGGYGNTLPAVEDALMGQEAGFQTTLNLTPETAFGERDESLLRSIAKKDFPPGVKVGGQLELREAEGEFQLFNVVKIKGDTVILDGNHPLAGMSLKVTVKVVSVRAASAEEVAHGHAHGDHGHHH